MFNCLEDDNLFAETGNGVESALLPVAALPLKVSDVHLVPQTVHNLFRKQVVHKGRFYCAVIINQLQQKKKCVLVLITAGGYSTLLTKQTNRGRLAHN